MRLPLAKKAVITLTTKDFLDWQRDASSYTEMAVYGTRSFSLSGKDGALPERLIGTILRFRHWGAVVMSRAENGLAG